MAELVIEGGNLEFTWQIVDLSAPFNRSNYTLVGITSYTFTQRSTSISGSVDSVNAPTSGSSYSSTAHTVSYNAGTYKLFAYTLAANGYYYPTGPYGTDGKSCGVTFTVADGGGVKPTRPANWSWNSIVRAGSPIGITARDWSAFQDRINEFRDYKGLGQYWFTTVSSNTPMYAYLVNQAITAISQIPGHGSLPSDAESGKTIITASFFNSLASALNNVQ